MAGARRRAVGRRFWNNTNTTEAPGYTVADLGLGKRLARDVTVDLRVYNITDEIYATDFYFNEFARNGCSAIRGRGDGLILRPRSCA